MKKAILLTIMGLMISGTVFAQQYYTEQDIRDAYDRGFRNGYGIGYNDSRAGYYYRAQNPGNLNPQMNKNNNAQGFNNNNAQSFNNSRAGSMNAQPNQNNWQAQQFEQLLLNLDNYYINMMQYQNRNQASPVQPNQAGPDVQKPAGPSGNAVSPQMPNAVKPR